ncbi:hypothetical protein JCM14469_05250 [Desulfatiferula olefinivorans]
MEHNRRLGKELAGQPPYRIAFIGNVMQPQVKDLLEYALRMNGINARLDFGGYSTLVHDAGSLARDAHAVCVFYDSSLLVEESPYALECMDEEGVDGLAHHVKAQLQLVFDALCDVPVVLANEMFSVMQAGGVPLDSNLNQLCNQINAWMRNHKPGNVQLIPMASLISASGGVEKAYDSRFFYTAKSPYTVTFLRIYAEKAASLMMSVTGRIRKMLIVDCDNTLWGGVVGELGLDGIGLSRTSAEGRIYTDVQWIIKSLVKRGVVLGLCSRNDEDLVAEVFRKQPSMVLSEDDVAVRRINWTDKAENIQSMALELRLGLDSVVFLDDSDYECDRIRSALPEVEVWQVPQKRSDYPSSLWRWVNRSFGWANRSADNDIRTAFYNAEKGREKEAVRFTDMTDYLKSLNLSCVISENETTSLPRAAQLTQRTNQFNLMTARFTDVELKTWAGSPDHYYYTLSASDRFGDYGTCGFCMVTAPAGDNTARVVNFMMSCRVLGRGLERAFLSGVLGRLGDMGKQTCLASFIPTKRNDMCKAFLPAAGFCLKHEENDKKTYSLDIKAPRSFLPDYVEVKTRWDNEYND